MKLTSTLFFLLLTSIAYGQRDDLPKHTEPGKCYAKTSIPVEGESIQGLGYRTKLVVHPVYIGEEKLKSKRLKTIA